MKFLERKWKIILGITMILIYQKNIFAKGEQKKEKITISSKKIEILNTSNTTLEIKKIAIHSIYENNKKLTDCVISPKKAFECKIEENYIGRELQLKINPETWFILSPFDGKFFFTKEKSRY